MEESLYIIIYESEIIQQNTCNYIDQLIVLHKPCQITELVLVNVIILVLRQILYGEKTTVAIVNLGNVA